MKKAPNYKKQPKGALNAVIFAGADAWNLAKAYEATPDFLTDEMQQLERVLPSNRAETNAPPIILTDEQLAEITELLIVPMSVKNVTIYRANSTNATNNNAINSGIAGGLTNAQISAICANLAKHSNVITAELYNEQGERITSLSEQINRLRNNPEEMALYEQISQYAQAQLEQDEQTTAPIIRAEDSTDQKARAFKNWLGAPLAKHTTSGDIFQYNGKYWQTINRQDLGYQLARLYEESGASYSARAIENVIETLVKYQAPPMGETNPDLIAFNNGVLNRKTLEFTPHDKAHYLTECNPIDYHPNATNTPNFDRWLEWTADGNAKKARSILGALYAIFTNQYNKQIFIEVTGEGGSGKTVFSEIAKLLVGEQNTGSADLSHLDDDRKRASIYGKTLIICPDQSKYIGDGSGLKAISGGDFLNIDPKHKKPFQAQIKAMILITNNDPIKFTERNGGIDRRRIIFVFDRVVPKEKRDYELMTKISAELSGIIKKILNTFNNDAEALQALQEQAESNEALRAKEESDHITAFCTYFNTSEEINGLYIGNARKPTTAYNEFLYVAYLCFLESVGIKNGLTLNNFSKAIKQGIKQQRAKHAFKMKRFAKGNRTNIHYKDAEAFFEEFIKYL